MDGDDDKYNDIFAEYDSTLKEFESDISIHVPLCGMSIQRPLSKHSPVPLKMPLTKTSKNKKTSKSKKKLVANSDVGPEGKSVELPPPPPRKPVNLELEYKNELSIVKKYISLDRWTTLKNYQQEDVCQCIRDGGKSLLALDPGMGKTVISLLAARCFISEFPLYIICPSSICGKWKRECAHWLKMSLDRIHIISENKFPDANSGESGLTGCAPVGVVYIMSYERSKLLFEQGLMNGRKFKCIILDESHRLRNLTSGISKALSVPLRQAKCCFLLSGTPAPNCPRDFFSQLQVLRPMKFNNGTYWKFIERYCNPKPIFAGKPRRKVGTNTSGSNNLTELNAVLLANGMIRRRGMDHTDEMKLPGKTRKLILLEPAPDKAIKLQQVMEDYDSQIKNLSKLANGMTSLSADASTLTPLSNSHAIIVANTRNFSEETDMGTRIGMGTNAETKNENKMDNIPTIVFKSSKTNSKSKTKSKKATIKTPAPTLTPVSVTMSLSVSTKKKSRYGDSDDDESIKDMDKSNKKTKKRKRHEIEQEDNDDDHDEKKEKKEKKEKGQPKRKKVKTSQLIQQPDELYFALVRRTTMLKKPQMQEYLEDRLSKLEPNRKVVIFAHHNVMLKAMKKSCEICEIPFIFVNGAVTSAARTKLFAKFQDDPEYRVAIISIEACKEGIDLTSGSLIIFAEFRFGYDSLIQGEARCHRIGQKNEVEVEYVILKGSVEERNWFLVQRKLRNAGLALDNLDVSFGIDGTIGI